MSGVAMNSTITVPTYLTSSATLLCPLTLDERLAAGDGGCFGAVIPCCLALTSEVTVHAELS